MVLTRIRDLRDEHDLNQVKTAKLMGVSKSTYARWETDEAIIPLIHLNDLCNYFNVSMDYITGFSNKKNYDIVNKKLNKALIGKRLKEFRQSHNLTQEKLAKEINTSHSTISGYEHGKNMILTAFAYQIAKKFGVSMDWLCCRID